MKPILHPWEKEYREKKLVTMGTEPSEDAKRFLKWLKKVQGLDVSGKRVLDTGCGNGKNSFLFAEHGSEVVGYDISQTAIDHARELQKEKGFLGAHFYVHNMADTLDVADATVDIVLDITSSNALTTAEREVFLEEAFRVMRDGAYMFLRALCKDGDENAKYLIKNFPGSEKDMYHLVGSDIYERAFTKSDLLATYSPFAEILHMERIFHYPTFQGRVYKRAYWIVYLQKKSHGT
jgi:ubiquinone/menaquinone biosynthesis C-methylase UbiE